MPFAINGRSLAQIIKCTLMTQHVFKVPIITHVPLILFCYQVIPTKILTDDYTLVIICLCAMLPL